MTVFNVAIYTMLLRHGRPAPYDQPASKRLLKTKWVVILSTFFNVIFIAATAVLAAALSGATERVDEASARYVRAACGMAAVCAAVAFFTIVADWTKLWIDRRNLRQAAESYKMEPVPSDDVVEYT